MFYYRFLSWFFVTAILTSLICLVNALWNQPNTLKFITFCQGPVNISELTCSENFKKLKHTRYLEIVEIVELMCYTCKIFSLTSRTKCFPPPPVAPRTMDLSKTIFHGKDEPPGQIKLQVCSGLSISAQLGVSLRIKRTAVEY